MSARRNPGFMSYTSDPSLRKKMSGPIEPMEYPSRGLTWEHWLVIAILAGAVAFALYGLL